MISLAPSDGGFGIDAVAGQEVKFLCPLRAHLGDPSWSDDPAADRHDKPADAGVVGNNGKLSKDAHLRGNSPQ